MTPRGNYYPSMLVCAIIVGGVSLAGCGLHPFQIVASGNADVVASANADIDLNLTPSPKKSPVVPMLMPGHQLNPGECLIAVVDVDGVLVNSDATGIGSWGENPVALFRERLNAVAQDGRVRGMVLRINSPGGSVTASDIMWRDLVNFKQKTGMPVTACLMDVAAGGGYYLATGADRIFAHPTTVTGAIGCNLNLYNLQDLMAQFNIASVPLKAGKNIDLGSPLKPLDEDHRKILQDMADEFHQRFRTLVKKQRPSVEDEATTFDGRVFTARQAAKLNLVDDIAYFDDAVEATREIAGIKKAELVFFHRPGDCAFSPYSITPNVPLQNSMIPLNVPGLDRSRLPGFLYMWQIEPSTETIGGK